ncbi:hypothetical protein OJ253_1236 [Cryptosporidium canis]|uniref:Uncharacterized protein n=1 Tax=Cryptosporidium canis TaxID=195482 RepID=A0A9D5DHE6_9CRYT|nr:hypothetical protein OJ253_1236 [Cryptosporidium canis]
MESKVNQMTVTSIPETVECDFSEKKDGRLLILESKNDISAPKDLFKQLRGGLRSNCNINNRSYIEDRLKDLIVKIFPDSDFSINDVDTDDDGVACIATKEDILQILEKSRQLNKENIQVIDGVEVLLSGQGGRPFARLESDHIVQRGEVKEFESEQRAQILEKLDQLLISTLKCTAKVDQANQINANANINHYPNSLLSKDVSEMGDLITSLYTNSFKGTQALHE